MLQQSGCLSSYLPQQMMCSRNHPMALRIGNYAQVPCVHTRVAFFIVGTISTCIDVSLVVRQKTYNPRDHPLAVLGNFASETYHEAT